MKCVAFFLIAACVPVWGQTASSIPAATNGSCSPAVTGNKNNFLISCKIYSSQGKHMVDLLNKILANQIDPNLVMGKLDEILKAASHPSDVQNCAGSNCFQGTNNGKVEMKQYGAPKLMMTDEQHDAIREAMKPYAKSQIGILVNNATEDSMAFANKLCDALQSAGIIAQVQGATLLPVGGNVIPQGISMNVGPDRMQEATALALAMKNLGLVPGPIPVGTSGNGTLAIFIVPNR